MIDKFINRFEEFAKKDCISDFSNSEKITLFGVYIKTMQQQIKATQPQQAKPSGASRQSSSSRINKPNRPATVKQVNFIRTLVGQGKIDDNDFDVHNLTVGQASSLINQGMNSPKAQPAPPPAAVFPSKVEEKEEEEFTGSYTHSSGGSDSAPWY